MAQSPAHDARFRRIYDENFEAIRRYCLRRLPLIDANDAVSEVFLVAWKRRDAIPDNSTAWLYGVARNVVRNITRRIRRSERLIARANAEPVYPTPESDVQVIRNAEDGALLKALGTLSASDQEVLMLRAWEGLSAADVADVVGCSVAAAEKRLARAMHRLESAVQTANPHARRKEVR